MTILHDATTGEGIGQSSPLPTKVIESTIMQPVDLQGRYQQTIQTHNAVSVTATTGTSASSWIDTNGFNEIALNILNDANTASKADIHWSSDGVTIHGQDKDVLSSSVSSKSTIIPTKLRYMKVILFNTDASSHIMSAWAYLKA